MIYAKVNDLMLNDDEIRMSSCILSILEKKRWKVKALIIGCECCKEHNEARDSQL